MDNKADKEKLKYMIVIEKTIFCVDDGRDLNIDSTVYKATPKEANTLAKEESDKGQKWRYGNLLEDINYKRNTCLVCGRRLKHHHFFYDKHSKLQDFAGSILQKYAGKPIDKELILKKNGYD
jgi:hypothetical protein